MPGFWSILNVTVEIEEVSLNPTMAQDTVARVVPMPPAHVTSNASWSWNGQRIGRKKIRWKNLSCWPDMPRVVHIINHTDSAIMAVNKLNILKTGFQSSIFAVMVVFVSLWPIRVLGAHRRERECNALFFMFTIEKNKGGLPGIKRLEEEDYWVMLFQTFREEWFHDWLLLISWTLSLSATYARMFESCYEMASCNDKSENGVQIWVGFFYHHINANSFSPVEGFWEYSPQKPTDHRSEIDDLEIAVIFDLIRVPQFNRNIRSNFTENNINNVFL